MADLSIVIPSYNTRELLRNCLDSILKTTKTSLEIIIVDNGSTDGTAEAIKSFALLGKDHLRGVRSTPRTVEELPLTSPRRSPFGHLRGVFQGKVQNFSLRLIENKQNLGFAKAINQGLAEAKGKYLLILNSDTKILDKTIDKEIFFLQTHLEVGVVGCQLKNPDGTIQPSGGYLPNLLKVFFWMSFLDDLPFLQKILRPYHIQEKDFYTHQRYLGWVTGAFFLTKREVFEKVGFFDEAMFMYVEEVDWCKRVEKAGFKVALDPNGIIVHYKSASTKRGKAGILEEYQGLKYYFAKYKTFWQLPILRFFLKIGSLVRIIIFGIILKDLEAKRIYAKAAKMA